MLLLGQNFISVVQRTWKRKGTLSFKTQIYQEFGSTFSIALCGKSVTRGGMYRFRSSTRGVSSMRKGVLTNFTKFIGKHMCQSLFFKGTLMQS